MTYIAARLLCVATLVSAVACGREAPVTPTDPQASEEAKIYAAAIGATARRGNAYVERLIRGPADPGDVMKVIGPSRLNDGACAAIRRLLAGRTSMECIDDARGLVGTAKKGSAVINNGKIISLGVIVGVEEFPGKVHVNVRYYCANLCGGEMTLVIERVLGEWTVTGTTGRIAVS